MLAIHHAKGILSFENWHGDVIFVKTYVVVILSIHLIGCFA